MTRKQWEKEIKRCHPVITCFPKIRWSKVVEHFGWLPLPIFKEEDNER